MQCISSTSRQMIDYYWKLVTQTVIRYVQWTRSTCVPKMILECHLLKSLIWLINIPNEAVIWYLRISFYLIDKSKDQMSLKTWILKGRIMWQWFDYCWSDSCNEYLTQPTDIQWRIEERSSVKLFCCHSHVKNIRCINLRRIWELHCKDLRGAILFYYIADTYIQRDQYGHHLYGHMGVSCAILLFLLVQSQTNYFKISNRGVEVTLLISSQVKSIITFNVCHFSVNLSLIVRLKHTFLTSEEIQNLELKLEFGCKL